MQWLTEETGWLFPEDDAELLPDQPEQLPALGAGLAGAAECVMIGCADSDAAAAAAHLLCGGAAAAGLQQGDIIMEVNGVEVGTMNKLNQELVQFSIGDSVTLTVMRDKTEQTFEVQLGGVAIFDDTEKD